MHHNDKIISSFSSKDVIYKIDKRITNVLKEGSRYIEKGSEIVIGFGQQ